MRVLTKIMRAVGRWGVYLSIIPIISACGGGGGSDDGSGGANFAGIWSGVLFLVQNDCPFDPDDDIIFRHTVNQDGTRVVVNTNPDNVFQGTTDGVDGFTVFAQVLPVTEVSRGITCTLNAGLTYVNVQKSEADVAAVTVLDCVSGAQRFQCTTEYVGVGSRE